MKRAPIKLEKPGRGKVNKGQNLFGFTRPRENNCDTRGGVGGGAFYQVPNTVTKFAITFTIITMKQQGKKRDKERDIE